MVGKTSGGVPVPVLVSSTGVVQTSTAGGGGGTSGAANMANGQVTAGAAAATLIAANATRRSVTFLNTDGTNPVYIGVATVTAGNGLKLAAGASISVDYVGLIQVIAPAGSPVVCYMETYD